MDRRKFIKLVAASALTAPVWIEEIKRIYGDDFNQEGLKKSLELKIKEIQKYFGIMVNVDPEYVSKLGQYNNYTPMDSLFVLDSFLDLLQTRLWVYPPDKLGVFLKVINIAYELDPSSSRAQAEIGGKDLPDFRKRIDFSIDKYFNGLFSIQSFLDLRLRTANMFYAHVIHHEIGRLITDFNFLEEWTSPEISQDSTLSFYELAVTSEMDQALSKASDSVLRKQFTNRKAGESSAEALAYIFTGNKLGMVSSALVKTEKIKKYLISVLSLPEDYFEKLYSGDMTKEKWKEYWDNQPGGSRLLK